MRDVLDQLLRAAGFPNPERAEQLWVDYRTDGPNANAAFTTLMAWYGGTIYRRIWGFVRCDAAEDVFQDVLVKLHRERRKLATFADAMRWLRTVASTQCVDAHRRESRRKIRERVHAGSDGAAVATEAQVELQEALRVELAKLPEREREAIALVFFEGLTRQDSAVIVGVHRDTFAKLLDGALARLRVSLAGIGLVGTTATTATVEAALTTLPLVLPGRLAGVATAVWEQARTSVAGWFTTPKVLALVLVGGLATAASAYYFSRSSVMPAKSPVQQRVRLDVEPLEARTVPTGFLSAMSLSSETGHTNANDMATDAAGNTYLTGHFNRTTDFDPNHSHPGDTDILTARGPGDAFVAKYAADNSLVWVRRMGGDEDNGDAGAKVAVDAVGNVYVAGNFRGSADFGSITLTSAGGIDSFVAKLNSNGSVQWANRWGGTFDDYGAGVETDATGNIYVLGTRKASSTGQNSNNGYDILKFNSTGGSVWSKWVNTKKYPLTAVLTVDATGSTFVGGVFVGTVDFDPGSKSKTRSAGTPNYSGFVLKLTSAGNFGWVGTYSGGFSNVSSLALDGGGNVIVGGYCDGATFVPSSGASVSMPTGTSLITKLNAVGQHIWTKGTGSARVSELFVDSAGNIYSTGQFSGTVDFDSSAGGTQNRTAVGGYDAYALRLDAAGNFVWIETFGGTGLDGGKGITVSSSGTVTLTGQYAGTVDFDPDPFDTHELTAAGTFQSIFVIKLSQN